VVCIIEALRFPPLSSDSRSNFNFGRLIKWLLLVLFVLIAILALGLSTDNFTQLLGEEPPPGPHTLASGAFKVDADVDGLCANAVERSSLWQAYMAEHLRQSAAEKPVINCALMLTRNIGQSPTVSGILTITDAKGKTLYQDSAEIVVHRPRVKYRTLTIMTLDPGESDWRRAENIFTSTYVNIAAARVMASPPKDGAPYVPAMIEGLQRESAKAEHFDNAAGLPVTKYSLVHAEIVTSLANIAKAVPAAIQSLASALTDPGVDFRLTIAGILAMLKSDAAPAIPALTARLKDEDNHVRAAAAQTLGVIGPESRKAIPELVHALRDSDLVRSSAVGALRKIYSEFKPLPPEALEFYKPVLPELIEDLSSSESWLRRASAIEIGRMGADAKSAVSALATLLGDKQEYMNREAAAVALQKLGPDAQPAVPALIEALKDTGGVVAYESTKALGAIGPGAKAAVPALTEALKDERILIRNGAAVALGYIGKDAQAAADGLLAMLKDKESSLRIAAAEALGRIGADSAKTAPVLIECLNDEAVIKPAIQALGDMTPSPPNAIPGLISALKNRNAEVRLAAVDVLIKFAPRPPEISSALAAAMKDRDENVHLAAAKAIAAGDAQANSRIIPELIDALIHGDHLVSPVAAEALKKQGDSIAPDLARLLTQDFDSRRAVWPLLSQLGPAGKAVAVNAMTDMYQKGDRNTRRAIVNMLKDFGADGALGIPILIECFKENDTAMNNAAREALRKIGAAAAPALSEALKHKDVSVRQNAANLLAEIGPAGASSVPALIESLKDYKTSYRSVLALGNMGAAAKEAVPAMLHAVLRIDDVDDAAKSIANIGSSAVPALIDGLKDSNSRSRWIAATALGYLGGSAQEAVPALNAVLSDKDSSLKKAATEALARVKSGK
jgi:HEAT repeat protein